MSDTIDMPTADDVAVAVVAACRLTGESPLALDVVGGGQGQRAGITKGVYLAGKALKLAFPDVSWHTIGRILGRKDPRKFAAHVHTPQGLQWWRDDWLDDVLGAIVAPRYGDAGE